MAKKRRMNVQLDTLFISCLGLRVPVGCWDRPPGFLLISNDPVGLLGLNKALI